MNHEDVLDGHVSTGSIDIDGLAGSETELRQLNEPIRKKIEGLWNGNKWRNEETHDE